MGERGGEGGMFPHAKGSTIEEVWARLRSSPVGASLDNGSRQKFVGKHLEHLARSPEIITTIPVPYGGIDEGWISLWQAGGGLKIIVWVTPLAWKKSGVKEDITGVRVALSAIPNVSEVQLRVQEPHLWLKYKGWPLDEVEVA